MFTDGSAKPGFISPSSLEVALVGVVGNWLDSGKPVVKGTALLLTVLHPGGFPLLQTGHLQWRADI
jgi:hypothetical protein